MRWFEFALVVLTLFTGIVWLLDKWFFAKRRTANAGLLEAREPLVVDYSKCVARSWQVASMTHRVEGRKVPRRIGSERCPRPAAC